jgi:hypothetical protein
MRSRSQTAESAAESVLHCPQCGSAFEPSALIREQVEVELREAMRGREVALLQQQRALTERERELTLDVERRVAIEARRISDREAKLIQERCARDGDERLRQKEEELLEARKKMDAAAAREAAFLRQKRELEERERQLAVDLERRLSDETRRIREEEAKRAEQRAEEKVALDCERQRLREAEHRQKIEGLQRDLQELQRRVQQGSQQAQGEAQEAVLRDLLASAFEVDGIEDVAKGERGADLLQRVRTDDGRDCGTIAWESKRTKAWSDGWLPKLRDDQRASGACCAVLVSQELPRDVKHFGLKDGVWVCAWPYAPALGAALRAGMIDVALARRVAEGRGEKMHMLYEYLTGAEFRNRVGGFVEAFQEMQEDLEREKRAMLTMWKRRERQMQRARDNITAFYGDLRGIAGRQLEDLPSLTLEPASVPELPCEGGADPPRAIGPRDITGRN